MFLARALGKKHIFRHLRRSEDNSHIVLETNVKERIKQIVIILIANGTNHAIQSMIARGLVEITIAYIQKQLKEQ